MHHWIQEMREKVATACRILAMEGLMDGVLGHVSVRIPDSQEMLIRCRGPKESGVAYTSPDMVRRVAFDGRSDDLQGQYEIPKEYPIHGEIYRARQDVGCVIHAHPPAVLMCTLADTPLRPIFGAFNIPAMRMAERGIPLFPRSCLISRRELAVSLVDALGDHDVCLMKGHGVTVTGTTVEEATMRAINVNILASVTWRLFSAGCVVPEVLEEDRLELPDLGRTFNDQWTWNYYCKKLALKER